MDNLVPPLEICKQLKEAGFPQKSHYYYTEWNGDMILHHWVQIPANRKEEVIAAPTAQELADQLPPEDIDGNDLAMFKELPGSYIAGYYYAFSGVFLPGGARGNTMAEALAALYLSLKSYLGESK